MKKGGLILGILFAVALHAGVLLFGGTLLSARTVDYATAQKVDLVTEDDAAKKTDPEEPVEQQDLQNQQDQAPDASKIIEKLQMAPEDNAPKLEAASLSAIEAALNGGGAGGGEFGEGMSFASGGRIGGTGKAGAGSDNLDDAFSMSEIDQKPRVVFQSAANYPASMHNEKGEVEVIFIVDKTGRATNVKAAGSSNPGFEKAALESVRQWKFEPAVRGGERVSCKMKVTIRFQPR
jgi:protein TonB